MISDECRNKWSRNTENQRGDKIPPEIDMHLADIGESDRWRIRGELDDEDGECEVGMDEVIEFFYK